MSYETILEQIKDLPEECLDEISNYVSYVVYRYEKQKTAAEIIAETEAATAEIIEKLRKNGNILN